MNSANGIDIPASPAGELALTPEALAETLRVNAPSGPVTVKGMATDVKYWSRNGDDKVLKIYGRLVLGDASIRFELQPHAAVRNDAPVVLHGSLRIKKSETFRTTHEVILVGDVVGSWVPYEPVPLVSPAPWYASNRGCPWRRHSPNTDWKPSLYSPPARPGTTWRQRHNRSPSSPTVAG